MRQMRSMNVIDYSILVMVMRKPNTARKGMLDLSVKHVINMVSCGVRDMVEFIFSKMLHANLAHKIQIIWYGNSL